MKASVSRRKAECCILGTTSLLYHCLEKGASVAFVLRDVGVLLIEGSRVQMRFYLDCLEKVVGEMTQDSVTLKVRVWFTPCSGRATAVPQHCWDVDTRMWPGVLARQENDSTCSTCPEPPVTLATLRTCWHLHISLLQALHQLDMVMPRAVPISSLSFTGRVIIFPK